MGQKLASFDVNRAIRPRQTRDIACFSRLLIFSFASIDAQFLTCVFVDQGHMTTVGSVFVLS